MVLVATVALASLVSQEAAGRMPDDAASRIVFHAAPAVDLWFQARAALPADAPAPPAELAPAVEAMRALDRRLGGAFLAWAPLDGLAVGCDTVAALQESFARAPESLALRGGGSVELRKEGLALAAALAGAEAAHAAVWKEREERIAAARRSWEERVGSKQRELLAFHLASLGMEDPWLELPVWLVHDAPWPGAVTVRGADGRGVSIVAASAAEGTLLLEIVLHEVTHSLDLAAGDASAFGALRAKLGAAGVGPRDRRLHDLPHALMFVQAAESIRRVVDPAHRDYGEVEGVYGRMDGAAELRGFWRDVLDGKLGRDEALDALVESLGAAPK